MSLEELKNTLENNKSFFTTKELNTVSKILNSACLRNELLKTKIEGVDEFSDDNFIAAIEKYSLLLENEPENAVLFLKRAEAYRRIGLNELYEEDIKVATLLIENEKEVDMNSNDFSKNIFDMLKNIDLNDNGLGRIVNQFMTIMSNKNDNASEISDEVEKDKKGGDKQ